MSPIDKGPKTGFNSYVAAELRAERSAKKMTYDQLAARSGVNRRTMARLLQAQRGIDTAHLASLCEALDVDVASLIERAETRAKDATGSIYGVAPDSNVIGLSDREAEEQINWDQAAAFDVPLEKDIRPDLQ
ncbi:helix-turn-helix domain-containing protein [Winkia sp. UMB0889B]|uniref:helix-turn-helix domain-containing protein n=1 Tax=Winkia sp. UMB0889B TaxID=3046315 RepID=UPI002552BD05|nr:helix-turn-helix transcriptional regulator [Winkia sp. UMB0889B]MDK7904840.1 helix-turn-helix transcriptional regulator [Winkia sp. UMB0889B]